MAQDDREPWAAAPLGPRQLARHDALRQSLLRTYDRLGVAAPFALGEVVGLVDRAAEIAVRVRDHARAGAADGSDLARALDRLPVAGAASDFLWSLTEFPSAVPKGRFVHELACAALRDAHGALPGLPRERLEGLVTEAEQAARARAHPDAGTVVELCRALRHGWNDLQRRWAAAVPQDDGAAEALAASASAPAELARLQAVLRSVKELRTCLRPPAGQRDGEPDGRRAAARRRAAAKRRRRRARHRGGKAAADAATTAEDAAVAGPQRDGGGDEEPSVTVEDLDETEDSDASDALERFGSSACSSDLDLDAGGAAGRGDDSTEATEAEQAEAAWEKREKARLEQEERRRRQRADDEGVLRIAQVKHNLDRLEDDLRQVHADAKHVDLQQLLENPAKAEDRLLGLHRRCTHLTAALSAELATLDSIVGSESLRPIRHDQVVHTQRLMDAAEKLKAKLQRVEDLLQPLAQRSEEEERAKQAAAAPAGAKGQKKSRQGPEPAAAEGKAADGDKGRAAAPTEKGRAAAPTGDVLRHPAAERDPAAMDRLWRQLRLQPDFEARVTDSAYVLSAYLPDMRPEDVSVSADDRGVLTVRGARVPSAEQEERLAAMLRRRVEPFGDVPTVGQLLRFGSGRYGSFASTFMLPEDARREDIAATYERGVLRVVLPRAPDAAAGADGGSGSGKAGDPAEGGGAAHKKKQPREAGDEAGASPRRRAGKRARAGDEGGGGASGAAEAQYEEAGARARARAAAEAAAARDPYAGRQHLHPRRVHPFFGASAEDPFQSLFPGLFGGAGNPDTWW